MHRHATTKETYVLEVETLTWPQLVVNNEMNTHQFISFGNTDAYSQIDYETIFVAKGLKTHVRLSKYKSCTCVWKDSHTQMW